LRKELSDSLSHYLNDTALLALFLDPCYKAMTAPRFSPQDRANAERIFRSHFPQDDQAEPRPHPLDLDAEIDAPVIGTLQSEGTPCSSNKSPSFF
jgi:hypothetical protein